MSERKELQHFKTIHGPLGACMLLSLASTTVIAAQWMPEKGTGLIQTMVMALSILAFVRLALAKTTSSGNR